MEIKTEWKQAEYGNYFYKINPSAVVAPCLFVNMPTVISLSLLAVVFTHHSVARNWEKDKYTVNYLLETGAFGGAQSSSTSAGVYYY